MSSPCHSSGINLIDEGYVISGEKITYPVTQPAEAGRGRSDEVEKPGYSKAVFPLAKAGVVWPQFCFALLLGLVILLNYYDIMHTIYLYSHSLAVEGNPLMGYLLKADQRLALMIKMGVAVVFAIVMLIYARIHFKRAFLYTSLIALVYVLVALWHMTGIYITYWLT
ncbi:MAG TPA: DUF5658 family protein [Syntrophomonadaceae bacterium]|nr:DUF5658 family protein [Syntrophomonadaceae bacterium]HRX21916.1 DUF5658 family protein [Syntrophomonadaceae bacterium]